MRVAASCEEQARHVWRKPGTVVAARGYASDVAALVGGARELARHGWREYRRCSDRSRGRLGCAAAHVNRAGSDATVVGQGDAAGRVGARRGEGRYRCVFRSRKV